MFESALARRRRGGQAGFTLVELLVVIVILAILAAVVVFAVGGINNKGNKAACEADTSSLETAEEAFYAAQTGDTPSYTSETGLVPQFIHKESKLHDIDLGNPTGSYTVTNQSGGGCSDAS